MRYAGLNLCERQSGKWRGRTTISRRGRSELRYVLNLMSIPLVGRAEDVWRLLLEEERRRQDARPEGADLRDAEDPENVLWLVSQRSTTSIRAASS